MKKRYYNSTTKEWYTEGNSLTRRVNGALFSGIPSVEQLTEWGFSEWHEQTYNPSEKEIQMQNIQNRMYEIQNQLTSTDYIAIKAFEGEDMTKYGNWRQTRHSLREEYNQLEETLNQLENTTENVEE